MSESTVIVFGYGMLVTNAIDVLNELSTQVLALVVPSNRDNADVALAVHYARDKNLPVLVQPSKKHVGPFVDELLKWNPDYLVVWSYSMILPPAVIAVPRYRCVNVHGGLLPEYRAAML